MTIRFVCIGLLLWLSCGLATAQVTTYSCQAVGGTNCTARIPDGPQAGITSTLQIPTAPTCTTKPVVSVQLNIVHNWIGDLQATVSGPSGSATLLSNLPGASVGGCQGADINALFSDGSAAATCGSLIPAVSGTVAPVSALTTLAPNNAAIAGTWTLSLTDTANSHDGALNDWSVQVACTAAAAPPVQIPATSLLANLGIALLLALVAAGFLRHRRISKG